jgi:hypothetical protein
VHVTSPMRRFLCIVVTAESPGNREITGKTGEESKELRVGSGVIGATRTAKEAGRLNRDVDSDTGRVLGNRSAFTWGLFPVFPCEGRSGAVGGFCTTSHQMMILLYNLPLSAPLRSTSMWCDVVHVVHVPPAAPLHPPSRYPALGLAQAATPKTIFRRASFLSMFGPATSFWPA